VNFSFATQQQTSKYFGEKSKKFNTFSVPKNSFEIKNEEKKMRQLAGNLRRVWAHER
jgi:hypothetical protein